MLPQWMPLALIRHGIKYSRSSHHLRLFFDLFLFSFFHLIFYLLDNATIPIKVVNLYQFNLFLYLRLIFVEAFYIFGQLFYLFSLLFDLHINLYYLSFQRLNQFIFLQYIFVCCLNLLKLLYLAFSHRVLELSSFKCP